VREVNKVRRENVQSSELRKIDAERKLIRRKKEQNEIKSVGEHSGVPDIE